jgi:hypothetical protein
MRSVILACAMAAALAACGQQAEEKVEAPPIPEGPGYTLALEQPAQLTLPEGSPISVTEGDVGLRLQGHLASPSSQLQTDGASFALGLQNEQAFSGQRVRVTFYARGIDGATEFHSAYSTNGDGNSGWRRLRVTEVMDEVSYVFDVPAVRVARDDFIGINPPAAGAVEVQWIRVSVEPAAPIESGGELRE